MNRKETKNWSVPYQIKLLTKTSLKFDGKKGGKDWRCTSTGLKFKNT